MMRLINHPTDLLQYGVLLILFSLEAIKIQILFKCLDAVAS